MLYVKILVTGKDIFSEYRIHVYTDHLSFEVSGLSFLRGDLGMRLKLIKASVEYKKQILDMLEEWYASGEEIIPYAIRRLDYHDFTYYCENLENKDFLSDGFVTDSTFFCLDEESGIVVGAVNIRHYLNESLLLDGGHIGDGVRPSQRRKGIATKMISLALEECKKLGIYNVLMVCDKDNIGSAKSIINNGGVLEDETVVDGIPQQRYWINLSSKANPGQEVVRHMSLEEVPECVQVIRNSFQTVADEFDFTEEKAPRFTAFATDERRIRYHFCIERRPMFVYMIGTQIVGYYSIAILNEDEAELSNLAVLPQYRHRNIGRKLLEDCFSKVREAGRTKLKIGIVEENIILRKWYEGFGFEHRGTEKYDFFPFTCGYMEKDLGGSDEI